MKKRVLLVVLCAASVASMAQGVKVGLKGGGGVSNGAGADANESLIRLGWHVGGVVQLKFTDNLGVQAEAQYSLKGDNAVVYGPGIMNQLVYLDIPVLAQYTLDDVFLEAGPVYSRLLSVRPNIGDPTSIDKLPFNNEAYGFAVGFGYQDPSGMQLGWRYTADLTNLYRPVDFFGEVSQLSMRNSTMQFYLGVLFDTQPLVKATVGTGKLAWKGGKFLFYTGPQKLVRAVRGSGQPASPTPTLPPSAPAPTPSTPPNN